MTVAKTGTGLLPSRFANLCENWLAITMSPTITQIYTGNTNCSHVFV